MKERVNSDDGAAMAELQVRSLLQRPCLGGGGASVIYSVLDR